MKIIEKITADFNNITGDENDPLHAFRTESFNEFKVKGIPSSSEEFWKYTNPSVVNDFNFGLGLFTDYEDDKFDIILANGKLAKVSNNLNARTIQKGLSDGIISSDFFEVHNNPLINLNGAFMLEGVVIKFDENTEQEVKILNVIDNTKQEQIIHPRIIVTAGKNCNVSLHEEIKFLGKKKNLVNSVTNFQIDEGANVEHIITDDFSENTYHLSNVIVKQSKDSQYISYNYSVAKNLSRKDFLIELKEKGAHCDLRGIYIADGKNHIDHHTIIEHEKENCTSNELYKGILADKSTGVFNDKRQIRFQKNLLYVDNFLNNRIDLLNFKRR